MTTLAQRLDAEILPTVERPSRYLGTELNTVHKEPNAVELRVALAFPDLYDLGLGNLGLHILYAVLNARSWCWCERAYAPAPDMETALRERGLPLFTNESKTPLGDMDLLGFTLQSELTYTSLLNMIDLAGLPLRSADRPDDAPLVCAGGPTAFNPEPLAPFIDFFALGDGEDVIVEIAECLRPLRGRPRRERLEALARIEGVYVPELYPFDVMPDGAILPAVDAPKITKRIVRDLNDAAFPADAIVPYAEQVHDRAGLEVLRGCTQGCRFCQAGMVTRPVRERSVETITDMMQRTLDGTGYEEVSLVSLSTCDYSVVRTMVQAVSRLARDRRVSVSLPSLRLDSFAVELAGMVADMRRSGLTFAPEAASPRLRAVINKWIPDEELLHMSEEAFRRGWNHVKTYFMIGLPTERDDDVAAIVDLCLRTLERGREVTKKARVNTGVSTFVPKPFTPFQWAEQISMEEAQRRQEILKAGFAGHPGIKFGRHTPETTYIEGLISRSDRRAADLIEAAWRHGARLDSWDEHLRFDAWQQAIEETGFDVARALGPRDLSDRLPWDHIDILVSKDWLRDEWNRAMTLQHAQDCRHAKCNKCGVIDRDRPLCAHMLRRSIKGRKTEREWRPDPPAKHVEPPAVQRLRFRIGRSGEARFLSHLELVNAWMRTLRRANVPLSYSQGFHALPRVNFASAPPVGEESTGDYMDIYLCSRVDPQTLLATIQATTAPGIHAYDASEVPLRSASLMSLARGYRYTVLLPEAPADLEDRIAALLASESLAVARRAKQRGKRRGRAQGPTEKQVDVRPMLRAIEATRTTDGAARLRVETCIVDQRSVKVREALELLGLDATPARVTKTDTLLAEADTPVHA